MAAGCNRRLIQATLLLGAATAVGVGLSQGERAVASVTSEFNGSMALPGATGASLPTVLIDSAGGITVIGSSTYGEGCPITGLSHDGSKAQFLGRPGTGLACTASEGPLQLGAAPMVATGDLALASQTADGFAAGRSQDGGASFTWSTASGPIAMPALTADPAINAANLATAFLVFHDATSAVPRIAVSTDGGLTYSAGDPLINPLDIDPTLWQGAGPGPLVGNLVARRDDTGLRLYSVIETADSAADRSAQGAAKTDNLNRVYVAIGTVALATRTAPPVVAWHDVEAFQAPAGIGLNRANPAIAVDSAGHVSVAFADGRHVYAKSDFDGTKWTATAAPVTLDAQATGLPPGMNSAVLPAIGAGSNGKVDVAWYGAVGGNPSQGDPASDARNTWGIYMAQTIDGGATWIGTAVSDHTVHQGALCVTGDTLCVAAPQAPASSAPATASPSASYPGDALAIAVDQASGGAAIAYADDQTIPGLPSLFATRQCTGLSAVTGIALVNDCVAPQPATPVLPGSTCPGPQVSDVAGDAIDNTPTGGGHDIYQLDIVGAGFTTVDAANQQAVIYLNRAQYELPADATQAWWRMVWTYHGARYYAQATIAGGQLPAYTVGALNNDGSLGAGQAVPGLITLGSHGSFTIPVPLAAVGNPPAGALLSDVHAATYAAFSGQGATALPVTLVDRAPDGGAAADFAVGGACAPAADIPDVPLAALLPVTGGVIGLAVALIHRKRSRRTADHAESTKVSVDSLGGPP